MPGALNMVLRYCLFAVDNTIGNHTEKTFLVDKQGEKYRNSENKEYFAFTWLLDANSSALPSYIKTLLLIIRVRQKLSSIKFINIYCSGNCNSNTQGHMNDRGPN